MDEPTVGIDPQSRRRILDTVQQLRDEYDITVLYTTHLMEEAQELSDRVGIIDHGEIIALGEQEALTQQVGEEDRLEIVVGSQPLDDAVIEQIQRQTPGVSRVLYTPPGQLEHGDGVTPGALTAYARQGQTALPVIIQLLDKADVEIQSVEVREPDLEAVFLALTGRALRD
jgi:ABC-2 type transport system ATP-binding protein